MQRMVIDTQYLWTWIRFSVSPENVVSLQKHLPDISTSDVIQLKRHGLPLEMIEKSADHYPDYYAEDYVKIRRSGVNAGAGHNTSMQSMQQAGIKWRTSFNSGDMASAKTWYKLPILPEKNP